MGESVKLHGTWPSPFSYRVTWALKLKGIPYEHVEEDLSNKSSLLLQYNPVYKKIPVLVHGGKPICESMVILHYLEDVWPQNPLLPTDPYGRAVARFWIKFAEGKVIEIWKMFRSTGKESEDAEKESLEFLETVEKHAPLQGNKFFSGEKVGMLDIAYASILYWLQVIEVARGVKLLESQRFPRLCSWIETFKHEPVIKENLPNQDEMLAYFKRSLETLKASAA